MDGLNVPFGVPELMILTIIIGLVVLVPGRIFAKAGYSRWLGLTMLVPILNLLVLCWFAFADWPALRR